MDAPLQTALVDAHVHFHSCFDAGRFLYAARDNFRNAASGLGVDPRFHSYLLLTESADADWFGVLKAKASTGGNVAAGWSALATNDDCELQLTSGDGTILHVVAGRQIATAERLEILALGTTQNVPDGYPAGETLRRLNDVGAIAVIPWGFGKWLGRRGVKVRKLVEAATPGELFLGDNSGRLAGAAEPPLFQIARDKGIDILPGTDPFPFRRHAERVGRMGCVVQTAQALTEWKHIREAIRSRSGIRPYGTLEGPTQFAVNQIAMQLRNRLSPSRRARV